MTDSITEVRVPDDRPPEWANSIMRWALTTRGIEKMVGTAVALLSFEGRKTGKRYTIPVSYAREDDTVTFVTKKIRKWWHNFESPHEVELRLAGSAYVGKAEVTASDDEALDYMVEYLDKRPVDAKAYGLAKTSRTREKIALIMPQIVVIKAEVTPV